MTKYWVTFDVKVIVMNESINSGNATLQSSNGTSTHNKESKSDTPNVNKIINRRIVTKKLHVMFILQMVRLTVGC